MQINRGPARRRRRPASIIFILLSVVLIAGLSFGGAFLWQRAEYSLANRGRAIPAQQPIDGEDQAHPAPVQTPPSAITAEREPAIVPRPPPQPDEPETPPGQRPFAVDWQVPATQPVDASYFERAVFLGDCVVTGLISHRVVENALIIAAIGATPQTALEEAHIVTPAGRVTMLQAAYERGYRDKVYIMFGSGSAHLETEEFIESYQNFINAVRERFPTATLYIQSMTPVAAHATERHPGLSHERVLELNAAIAELARANRLPFLNIFEALADENGYLPAGAASDGLHLSAEQNFLWLDYLKSHTVG